MLSQAHCSPSVVRCACIFNVGGNRGLVMQPQSSPSPDMPTPPTGNKDSYCRHNGTHNAPQTLVIDKIKIDTADIKEKVVCIPFS